MIDGLERRPVRGRNAKQGRSERARSAIAEGVIAVIADVGVAGLTHRRVADASATSLASTTYYFASKADMLADASNVLLRRYIDVFEQAAAEETGHGAPAYVDFVALVAANGLDRDRRHLLAWYELMIDGARERHARDLARSGYRRFDRIWSELAEGYGLPDADQAGRTGFDLTVGAMAHGISLGWVPRQYVEAIRRKLPPGALLEAGEPDDREHSGRSTPKGEDTRRRLLDAAIALLAEGGAAALTSRAVAARADRARGTPAYHFASSDELLAEAQRELFERQKARYREVIGGSFPGLTLDTMIELTAVIFQREATEFAGLNVSGYAIWMEAARNGELRPGVRAVMSELYMAWCRLLRSMDVAGDCEFEAMCIQFLFVGAQLRVLASGATAIELVTVRNQLKSNIAALASGTHWLQSAGRA